MINQSIFKSITVGVVALQLLGCQLPTQNKERETNYFHNIEGITEQKMTPEYWINKTNEPDKVLMSVQQIDAFNNQLLSNNEFVTDPLSYPDVLQQSEIKQRIMAISTPSKYDRFYPNGEKLTTKHYRPYLHEMALENIEPQQPIQFGLVTVRSAMRMLPTMDRVLNSAMVYDLDRFQETAAFPGESVAILHTSRSGEWLFVQNYNYRAWIKAENVATGKKSEIQSFVATKDFIIVTGDKVFTTYNPLDKSVSEIQLDMGVRLPLLSHQEYGKHEIARHNPYAGHVALFPSRNQQGQLEIKPVLIPRSADVNLGYLPYTKSNVIKQGFKFLGERYGWGHDYNGRDCTGFVGEIYKTFGLLMPRNSGQQGSSTYGDNLRFSKSTPKEQKMPAFEAMETGDLLYLPGHVAMVLGYDDDKPFLIHDVHGLTYYNTNNERIKGILNGVSVTPLYPFTSYLDGIYNIKKIR